MDQNSKRVVERKIMVRRKLEMVQSQTADKKLQQNV